MPKFNLSECVTVLTAKFVNAKKDHKCKECRRTIEVGEKYFYETYVGPYRGDPFRAHKTCRHCYPLRDLAMNLDSDGMFWYGMIYDQLSESEWSQDKAEWKVRLAIAGMRRKWKRKDGKMWRVLT